MKQKHHLFVLLFLLALSCEKTEIPTLSLSTNAIILNGDRNAIDSFDITLDGEWDMSYEPFGVPWIAFSEFTGLKSKRIYVYAQLSNNTSQTRSVKVTVRPENGSPTKDLVITQQPVVFTEARILQGGSQDDELYASAATADGGYIAVGFTTSSDGDIKDFRGGSDVWIVRYDANGNALWNKTFGGSKSDWGQGIIPLNDGSFLVTGGTESSDGDFLASRGGADIFVLNIDAQGDKRWCKTFGGSGLDYGKSLQATAGGNILLIGSTNSNDGDIQNQHGIPGSNTKDYWVMKMSVQGNKIWGRCFGSTADESAESVCMAPDGGYVIAGTTAAVNPNGDITRVKGNVDIWVCKLNLDGNLQWQKTFGGSFTDYTAGIIPGIDDGYIITGTTFSRNDNFPVNKGLGDGFLVKISDQGEFSWSNTFGSNEEEKLHAITKTPSGYILAGETRFPENTRNDGWVLNVRINGSLAKDKRIGGRSYESFSHVLILANGDQILTGTSASTDIASNTPKGKLDGLVVRQKD